MLNEQETTGMRYDYTYAYVELGWSVLPLHWIEGGRCTCGIDPCKSAGKHPLTDHGVNDATTDLAKLAAVFRRYPNANIGIRPPADTFVIDVDPRNGGDVTLDELEAEHGRLPETAEQLTGGGGRHILLRKPKGAALAGKLGQGLDIKTSTGYIVCEPSNHISGGHYAWEASSSLLDGHPLAKAPRWVLERLARGAAPVNGAIVPIGGPVLELAIDTRALADLQGALTTLDADDRELWIRMGMALRTIGEPGYALWDEWSKGGDKYNPADQRKRWHGFHPGAITYRSVFDAAQKAGWKNSASILAPQRERSTARDAGRDPLPRIKKAAELLAREFEEIRWLIPELLPEGLMLLAGPPKVGKSWLALDVALATATGGTVLGRPVEQGAVLYLALEDSDRRMQTRLRKLGAVGEKLGDFEYATEWPRGAAGAAAIVDWIDAHPNPRLVVVDIFSKMRASAAGSDSAYSTDYADVAMLKPPPDRGVSILLVHHTRKQESEDPLDTISGTLGLGGAADGAWIIKRTRGEDEAVLHLIGRDIEQEGSFSVRFDRPSVRWQWLGDAWRVLISAERKQVLEALRREPMQPKELAVALKKKPGAARKILKGMADAGQVACGIDGKYRAVEPEGTYR